MMDSVRRRRTQAARDQLDVALPALRQLQQAMETAADTAASQGPHRADAAALTLVR
jgi:hypothetical protein